VDVLAAVGSVALGVGPVGEWAGDFGCVAVAPVGAVEPPAGAAGLPAAGLLVAGLDGVLVTVGSA